MNRAKIVFALDKLYALPGWLMMIWMVSYFPNHPFRKERPTWTNWTQRRTSIMRAFDLNFWVAIVCLGFLFRSMLKSEWFHNLLQYIPG